MARRRIALIIALLVGAAMVLSAQAATVLLGDQLLEAKHDQNAAGRAEAFRTTATTSGTLTKLTVYVESTATATKLTAGLYADTNGHPGSLLAQGAITTVAKGAWNDVPISSAAVSAGTVYWIAILTPVSAGTIQFRVGPSGASEGSASATLTALPATWASGTRYINGPLSAYGSGDTSVSPILQVSPLTVSFGAQVGGSDPAAAQVSVTNGGGGSLPFTAASDSLWLTVAPTSGSAPQTLQVSASIASLSPGTYTGHVTVTSDGVAGSPATVTVTLQVASPTPPSPLDWPQIDYDSARTGTAAGETIIAPSNVSTLRRSWATVLDGKITAQPLFLKQANVGGQTHDVVIAATNANSVYALDAGTGAILWRKNFGSQASINAIPGGFGVGASPAVDKVNGRIYVVSDDGRLHSVSMADGSDAVTPLAIVSGPTTNKVWGGLNLNGSDLYIATASDGSDSPPWRGRIYHVSIAGNALQLIGTWDVVPGIAAPQGGGGIWGYGGVSVDTATGNVYATPGADSSEMYTPYANQIVALTGGLSVLGSYLPPQPTSFPCSGTPCDLDFGATPVVFHPSNCPTLTAVGNKNGNLYLTGTSDLAASSVPLQVLQLNTANDWLGNGGVGGVPAYWDAGRMIFVSDVGPGIGTINGGVVGLSVQDDCTLRVAWSATLGTSPYPDSTPTVANGVVFVGEGSGGAVHAYDAQTGAQLWRSPSATGTATYAAPIVADGQLIFGSWNGQGSSSTGTVSAYAPGPPDTTPPTVAVTAPAAGGTVRGTVTVTATANDNLAVAGVQFMLDGNPLGAEDTSTPYSVPWDTTTASAGAHTLNAVARDAAGNTATSADVTVTVDNSTPPPPTRVLLGDQVIETKVDQNAAGTAEAFRTTSVSAGTLSQVNVYIDSATTAATVIMGIYTDAGGRPGTLISQGTLASPVKGAWNSVATSAATITSGTTYWVAILGPAGGGIPKFRDKAGGGSESSASATLTALPATWVTGKKYTDGPMSAYGLGG